MVVGALTAAIGIDGGVTLTEHAGFCELVEHVAGCSVTFAETSSSERLPSKGGAVHTRLGASHEALTRSRAGAYFVHQLHRCRALHLTGAHILDRWTIVT